MSSSRSELSEYGDGGPGDPGTGDEGEWCVIEGCFVETCESVGVIGTGLEGRKHLVVTDTPEIVTERITPSITDRCGS